MTATILHFPTDAERNRPQLPLSVTYGGPSMIVVECADREWCLTCEEAEALVAEILTAVEAAEESELCTD